MTKTIDRKINAKSRETILDSLAITAESFSHMATKDAVRRRREMRAKMDKARADIRKWS